MTDIAPFFPAFPAISGKKVTAAFDGGKITSDAGVLLLAQAEKRLGIAQRLAALIPDARDPTHVQHLLPDILFARYLAIAAGYEDANDLDHLCHDPAFKMALGKTPEAKVGLVSQPTMSRWENAPDLRDVIRMSYEMIDIYCDSYTAPPAAITLDIDETFDTAHGEQQLTFWNGFYRERGYAPIHVYEAETARPVAFVLRPAKTPSGREVAAHVRRLIHRIRTHWPKTQILLRGDGHYSRPEVMAWCEAQKGVDYIFGQPGNAVLSRDPVITADAAACAAMKVEKNLATHRTHCETTYAAKSWNGVKRRIIARIETTSLGLDIRTIVTSLPGSTPERLYEADYCARGQAENLIKLHKTQLKSDRTSCSSACANQMRLILHTAAYWLLWEVRQAIPESAPLKCAEFTTLQNRIIKIGARVIETATRIRVAFASAYPDKQLFTQIFGALTTTPAGNPQAP